MDSLLVTLSSILGTDVIGKVKVLHILSLGVGSMIPFLVGILLPRKNTIHYGMLMNSFLGKIMFQKRVYGKLVIPANVVEAIIHTVQTTFQDISFGVYIDSRTDITPEERQKKIDEYLLPPAPPAA